jgi:hypothetical protein
MRHATDPDHVIAVSTIVTRQPTIRAALLIGSLWGVGHTLTIVAVGGVIVLFTIVIPPRLGLTMEIAVALMLIVLGVWKLTGFLEQIEDFGRQPEGTQAPSTRICTAMAITSIIARPARDRSSMGTATTAPRRRGWTGSSAVSAATRSSDPWPSGSSMDPPALRPLRCLFLA